MDLWVREARLFKYGSGTGTNFSHLRGEGERLSGGGRSSGLMGFLRIGDRAAGAIKSGGTTRRAAKMVIVDADHPDIEDFVNWKVVEEQKVAALVAGSKAHRAHLTAVMAAIRAWDGETDAAVDPARNEGLKAAIREAKRAAIPESYVARVLQYARQGYDRIEFPLYDTDWDSEAYATVSGQNSNNSIRVHRRLPEGRARGRAVGASQPHRRLDRQDHPRARPLGAGGPRRLGLRRPGHPVSRHRERLAHLPRGRGDPRLEPVLPNTCSSTTRPATWPRSTSCASGARARSTPTPTSTPRGSGR